MIVTVRSATDDLNVLLSVKPALEAFANLHEKMVEDDALLAVIGHVHREIARNSARRAADVRRDVECLQIG